MIEMPKSTAKTFSKDEFETVPTGEYEVTLESADAKAYGPTQDKIGLSCKFRIRSDVLQKGAGTVIYETLWLDEDPEWSGWFNHKKLQKILLSQANPKLDFRDCDECVQYINGLSMIASVVEEFDDYRGRKVNKLDKYFKFKPTAHPIGAEGSKVVMPADPDNCPF